MVVIVFIFCFAVQVVCLKQLGEVKETHEWPLFTRSKLTMASFELKKNSFRTGNSTLIMFMHFIPLKIMILPMDIKAIVLILHK